MFYLFFRYSLADQKKVYEEFKSKEDVIEFIEGKRDEIEIEKVIEAGREFKLNWILKLDEIDKPSPQRRGRPRKEKEKDEPKQLDQEEPKKEQEDKEKHWELCSVCEKNRVVSSNKRKICGECLQKEKEKKLGHCKRPGCGKEFELEDWQHSSLHWCPDCQQRPDYKNYDKRDRIQN